MTSGSRCQRRRKSMAGGRGTAESKKIDSNCGKPNLEEEITKKPSGSPKITKLSPTSGVEFFDIYSQARKALSFRSPFDSEDSQTPPDVVYSANTLPSGVSNLLSRHSDSRKRHKKLHSGSEKKSSTSTPRGNNIWVETEDYFRELTVEDIERIDISSVGFSSKEKYFLIPSLDNDGNLRNRYETLNRLIASACEKDNLNLGCDVGLNDNGKLEYNEIMVGEENGLCSMDVDDGEAETKVLGIKEESKREKRQNSEKDLTSFGGVEWLLGSRSKIYLASERPSKKRKLLGRDAGLEKLLVAHPVEGLDSVCDYCTYGDMADPLNCLIKCRSCGMIVHRRCYGVQEDVDSTWLCSWCKWKNVVDLNTETPCLLCPKQGGALKPVRKRGLGSENEGSKVEFAHLFCCQWIPEVYLENTRTMEPIMNMDELKDTRKKLTCYLCKVKCGACVRCSNGSCRTPFHPICAREARQRMEIWGKLGSEEVELRAFCSKHSEVQNDGGSQDTGDTSLTDGEELLDDKQNFESFPENGNALHPAAKYSTDRSDKEDANTCSAFNFTVILKKLIDLGKVNAKDVASEIGVAPESLNTMLTDNHMAPELQYKLVRWLKDHAHIGNSQKSLKVKIRSPIAPKAASDVAEGVDDVSVEESSISDAVSVKSVPPRRRTKGSMKTVKDDNSCSHKDKTDDETPDGDPDLSLVEEDSNGSLGESLLEETKKVLADSEQHQENASNDSIRIEDKLRAPAQCVSGDGPVSETKQSQQMTACSPFLINGEVNHASYIHPFVYSKLMQTNNGVLERTASYQPTVLLDRGASQLEASSSSGLCCNNHLQASSGDRTSRCGGVNPDQLVKPGNLGVLKLSPADEVEGELIYYQTKLLSNNVTRKRISDDLIAKIIRSLPQEIDTAGKRKWDAVLVSQYNHELREAKKQGRKERRHKEAQAVLAAATAAAAASSRISSIRKDTLEESSRREGLLKMNASDMRPGVYSQLNPRVKETTSRSTVPRTSFDANSDSVHLASDFSKDHPRTCDICRRSETVLNPILVCSSCKVAVHLDCYYSVKSTTGPWHCELCEDIFSRDTGAVPAASCEKPYFVAECGLCGGTAGAFRKSVDGEWIHALCAEWVLESTYRRGQVNPIHGMDTVCRGVDVCTVCHRKHGVCLKCSYGHCRTTFHPTCARSAGFYMTVRTNGGKLQHKAYCEKHSIEQRAKAGTQKHGIEELKSLKQVRVELERLRLLCERIIKREKLKRELVLCSHDILASNRDAVLSALARHPFYQPEVSSESATTSIKGYTDGYKSGSEMMQRSDDITVDSMVAGKRRVKLPMSVDNDQKTDDSSTSQNLYMLKPVERVSSGKQIPQRHSVATRNLSDDAEKRSKYKKHTETFEKELLMTSDQASMKNQRLPKGFVYVPVRCLSKEKETV